MSEEYYAVSIVYIITTELLQWAVMYNNHNGEPETVHDTELLYTWTKLNTFINIGYFSWRENSTSNL